MLVSAVNGSTRKFANGYEDAVKALSTLQSNSAYIKAASLEKRDPRKATTIQSITKYLLRTGITVDQLNSLSIIHVAGTKGKGSTCAFVESILREHGYRTGFYSSPHLINIRERFKINGDTISESEFVHYFWKVFNVLDAQKENQDDRPKYFEFLTIMMFHLFLEANLDVAIIEVGIGGEFDCTNVIQNPICTGIANLGLDHTSTLGNTIESIAFQKSGIFKRNSPAFTIPQSPEAMAVLKKRALEKGCDLTVVPSLYDYPWISKEFKLGIQSDIQSYNSSLAIQLSNCWIYRTKYNLPKEKFMTTNDIFKLSLSLEKVYKAISNCKWPGRTQIMIGKMADFYLDGAHTIESLQNCVDWYEKHIRDSRGKRYLIFNATGNRDMTKLLNILKKVQFDRVYFVPNVAGCVKMTYDCIANNSDDEQLSICRNNKDLWGDGAEVMDSIGEAFAMIASRETVNEKKPNILITGSLYLVGAALLILDPEFTMKTDL